MKALIQRVKSAKIDIDKETISSINKGLLIFIGIYFDDTINDINKLYNKIIHLRIFKDKNKLNVQDINVEILLVSQFTLFASIRKGTKPSRSRAAQPHLAEIFYNEFVNRPV